MTVVPRFKHKVLTWAIDDSGELQTWFKTHQPVHWKASRKWLKQNGVHCNFYKGILKMMYVLELERDEGGFVEVLLAAGYNP